MMQQSARVYPGWRELALPKIEQGMPNWYYHDPDHYQRELETLWYKMWINVGRSEEVESPRDYKVCTIGDQKIVVTRNFKGELHAFHNTCRHRGSALCPKEKGQFSGGTVVCRYHGWTYSLEGKLISTPHQLETADFDMADYSLYDVAVGEWGGFIFVNLAGKDARPLDVTLGDMPKHFENYHPERLKIGFRYVTEIKANWKLWNENYSECFHCPGLHPQLCKIIPAVSAGTGPMEQPEWEDTGGETMVRHGYDIIEGGVTWTMDGQLSGPSFPDLTEEEKGRPLQSAQMRPNFFFMAHPDYIHTHVTIPTSPTSFLATFDFLFQPSTLEREDFDPKSAYELWHTTNLQDAEHVEYQQAGMMSGSRVHEHNVFVPQEGGPYIFNQWIMRMMRKSRRRSVIED